MISLFPDKFWLWINSKCKVLPHPFNQAPDGAMNLNYSPWEFKHAASKDGFHVFESMIGNLEDFVRGKSIADLACGGGGKSVYLATLGAKSVKGCDFSDNFIRQAKAFAKEKNVEDKCHYSVGNGEKTPYKDEEFDIVLMSSVLEHTPNPQKMLEEGTRILKKGGYILFNTEGYYHWLGHHLWDALPIPWFHLFTSEKQQIRIYKKMTEKFKDGQARVNFRISKNSKGVEEISYLNHITLRKLERILQTLAGKNKLQIVHYKVNRFNNKLFRLLGGLPFFREIFHESVLGVLKKP